MEMYQFALLEPGLLQEGLHFGIPDAGRRMDILDALLLAAFKEGLKQAPSDSLVLQFRHYPQDLDPCAHIRRVATLQNASHEEAHDPSIHLSHIAQSQFP